MGDPSWAYKDTDLCPEEPEACNCLPLYGQSGECLWPQWPQSDLWLCQNTGSVRAFHSFFLALFHIKQIWFKLQRSCYLIYKLVIPLQMNVSLSWSYFFPSLYTNRQHFHHAGSGSPPHPEGAGRCGYPPAHTNCPFIVCCQGAVDGKGTIPWWLSCTQSTFSCALCQS